MSDIFISYSRLDRDFAVRLARDLEDAGLTVFFDQRIVAGDSWATALAKAIESARYLLVVLSPDAVSSDWINQETMVGMRREVQGKTRVIPLMLRMCEPPQFLASKKWADFTKDYNIGLQQLLHALTQSETDETAYDLPGHSAQSVSPVEIARLREELEAAVTLFKAAPQREQDLPDPRSSAHRKRQCFVVMPFGNEGLQVVYEDFVRPVIEDRCQLECVRGDDVFGSSVIMDDIRNSIERADIIVSDLTGKNANVFYEVGICHALDKPVLLMAQSIDDVPFDLRHRRVLLYEYSPRGCKKLEKTLHDNVLAMLEKMNNQ